MGLEGECKEFVAEAIARLAEEMECVGGHWREGGDEDDEEQLMNIVLHLQQVATGCKLVSQKIMDHGSEHLTLEIMRHYFAAQLGVDPDKVHTTANLNQFADWVKMGQEAAEGVDEAELRRLFDEQQGAETGGATGQEDIGRSDDPTES